MPQLKGVSDAKSFYDKRKYLELDFRSTSLENNSHLDYYRMAKSLKTGARKPVANLDGKRFRVLVNEPPVMELDQSTVFFFRQKSNLVTGTYEGNGIQKGDLAGFLEGGAFTYYYEHINSDRERESGTASGNVETLANGTVRMANITRWKIGNKQSSYILVEV